MDQHLRNDYARFRNVISFKKLKEKKAGIKRRLRMFMKEKIEKFETKSATLKLVLAMLLLTAVFLFMPGKANAAIASGTWGTCPWTIDDAGTLTIGAGTGKDTHYGSPWYEYQDKIINIKTSGDVVLPQDSSYLFYYLQKVKSIDLSSFNTKSATNMNYMFYNCSHLPSLDLSSFDTAKGTNMQSMFSGCQSLTSLDLSSFDTAKVTNMQSMFSGCQSLT